MSTARPQPEAAPPPAPVTTAAEARALVAHFTEVMDALVAMVQQETDLVRAGHLNAAAALETSKADLARSYLADALRLRSSRDGLARLVPNLVADLRRRHDLFHALLQINLTVLATAHAVSEGIVRGVSDELARKAAPETYGASGRTTAPPRSASTPLTLSRVL
jgi:hypothetical protein